MHKILYAFLILSFMSFAATQEQEGQRLANALQGLSGTQEPAGVAAGHNPGGVGSLRREVGQVATGLLKEAVNVGLPLGQGGKIIDPEGVLALARESWQAVCGVLQNPQARSVAAGWEKHQQDRQLNNAVIIGVTAVTTAIVTLGLKALWDYYWNVNSQGVCSAS